MEERLEIDPVERCLQHPPLSGHPGSTTVDLEVLDPFRTGDKHNAQVFTVQVMQASSEDDDDGYIRSFRAVDQSYSHETHAYDVLSEFQGTRIPMYYGSYSLDLPAEGKGTRIIRLILMEYINAKSMQQASPKDYPQDVRQQMLKTIIDFDSLVYERDILLRDLCPQNVMIVEKAGFDPAKDLIFIDFEDALFGRKRDDPIAMHTKGDANRNHFEYNWIDGAETLENYSPGGYHPIMIGDILHGRYRIVDKLGFGGYSTVWLAQDTYLKNYVAVKVGIADSIIHETNVLWALSASQSSSPSTHRGRDSIPSVLDELKLHGPNGTHPCYTMAPARCNLREVSYSRLFSLEVARALSSGLALAVAYMHSQGYVHGDIHLRNILVKLPSSFDYLSVEQLYEEYGEPETVPITRRDGEALPPNAPAEAVIPLYLGKDAREFSLSDTRLLLSDFGEAFSPDREARPGADCHTPLAMRPPEARFQPQTPMSYSADIWSLATAIWDIIGMKPIFSSEFADADDVTSQQIDVLGPMPSSWWQRWEERYRFFDDEGRPREGRYAWPPIEDTFEEGVQHYRRKLKAGEFDEEETAAILDLMRRMLVFRPEDRLTIEEVLRSEWMIKWALPDFERSLQMQ
ncbi:predicted protein [Paecilomyces variotii No. 5]|uniref:non-specific serine/threonine protein kinase n=1 Tax=Byssochlamys spectabilis (strain No. 5 / NBRC 109023) TaxID=1356009 RepID=V5FYB2_BYSSN|nr:predicted protein [Paecilomyces variotii No. 5]